MDNSRDMFKSRYNVAYTYLVLAISKNCAGSRAQIHICIYNHCILIIYIWGFLLISMDLTCIAQNIIPTYCTALYSTKKAQTYKALLNPHFEFNLYENFQFHIQLCFELSLKKAIIWSRTDLTVQFY